jgi:hypothetical protein
MTFHNSDRTRADSEAPTKSLNESGRCIRNRIVPVGVITMPMGRPSALVRAEFVALKPDVHDRHI